MAYVFRSRGHLHILDHGAPKVLEGFSSTVIAYGESGAGGPELGQWELGRELLPGPLRDSTSFIKVIPYFVSITANCGADVRACMSRRGHMT